MDFLGVGSPELLLILVIAFLILGPGRIARTARSVGKAVRGLRNTTAEFTRALTEEDPGKAVRELRDTTSKLTRTLTEADEEKPGRGQPQR